MIGQNKPTEQLKYTKFTKTDIEKILISIEDFYYGPDKAVSDNIKSKMKAYVARELEECSVPYLYKTEVVDKLIIRLKEKHDYAKMEPGERVNRATTEAIMGPTAQMALDMKKGKVIQKKPILKQLDPIFSANQASFPEMIIIPEDLNISSREIAQMSKELERVQFEQLIESEFFVGSTSYWFEEKSKGSSYRFNLKREELYLRKLLPSDIQKNIKSSLPKAKNDNYNIIASPYYLEGRLPFIDIQNKNIEDEDVERDMISLVKGIGVGGVKDILYAYHTEILFKSMFIKTKKLSFPTIYYDDQVDDNLWLIELNRYQLRKFGISDKELRERFEKANVEILEYSKESSLNLHDYLVVKCENVNSVDFGNIRYIKTEGSNFTYIPQLGRIRVNCTMTNDLGSPEKKNSKKNYGLNVLGVGSLPYHMCAILDDSFLQSSGKETHTKRRTHDLMIHLTSTGERTAASFYGMRKRSPNNYFSLGLHESASLVYKRTGVGARENTSRDSLSISLDVPINSVDFSINSKYLADSMERNLLELDKEKYKPKIITTNDRKIYKPKVSEGDYVSGIPRFIIDILAGIDQKIKKTAPIRNKVPAKNYKIEVVPFDNNDYTTNIKNLLEIKEVIEEDLDIYLI